MASVEHLVYKINGEIKTTHVVLLKQLVFSQTERRKRRGVLERRAQRRSESVW